jgi:putative alpha-1,2-mannosidase
VCGQRPSLDLWLKLHYIPVGANAWGPAADTLEDATADFAVSELARRMGDDATRRQFLERAQYWKNIFNPRATPEGGYIQNRNADGTWPKFDPASNDGFVEGSAAQYLWMVPFNAQGLFTMLGGKEMASQRLNAFFYNPDGSLSVNESGGPHAELNDEPSIETPWLFDFLGQLWKTQEAVRRVLNTNWTNSPKGMPAMMTWVRCRHGTYGQQWACIRRSQGARNSYWVAHCSRQFTSGAPRATSWQKCMALKPTHPTCKV